jgi:hypothetical protein
MTTYIFNLYFPGSSLKLIRVPTMDLKEFADGPAQTGIFSLQESHDIFLRFTASVKPKVEYPVTPRTGLKSQVSWNCVLCIVVLEERPTSF